MRDYDITVAHSRQAYGQVTWLVRLVQNWRLRRTLKRLQHLSDHQLHDIGLVRDELYRLIALPLTHDHVAETKRDLTFRTASAEPWPHSPNKSDQRA